MRTQSWTKVILAAGVAAAVLAVCARADDRVLLEDVEALMFRAGEEVVDSRSGEHLPRLQCAYNPLGDSKYLPGAVMCRNKGMDDHGGVVWKCSAELDDALRFDNIQVSCEGYSRPGDRFVRKGSCVLTYTLALTPAGEQKQQQQRQNQQNQQNQQRQPEYHYQQPRPDPQEQGYRFNDNNGHPHYYAAGANNYNNNVGETRVVSVWTFSNVLLFVLATYVVGRCVFRCCASKPERVTGSSNTNVDNSDASVPGAAPVHSSASHGWRWWFPLAAYMVGRHNANHAPNSRVYNVPPPQYPQQQQYSQQQYPYPSAPAPGRDSNSDSPATGHVSKRTGFADTVVR